MKKLIQQQPLPTPGPLQSWDIFMQHYHALVAMAEDARHLKAIMKKERWVNNWDPESFLIKQKKVILITDSTQHIIFASQNIVLLNGYHPNEVIGQTPKMFQGPDTAVSTTSNIRTAIKELRPFDVCVTNYKKNGQPYICEIQGFPIHAPKKIKSHFIAFEQLTGSAVF